MEHLVDPSGIGATTRGKVRLEEVPWRGVDLVLGLALFLFLWLSSAFDVFDTLLDPVPGLDVVFLILFAALPLWLPWYLARRRGSRPALRAGLKGPVLREVLLAIPFSVGGLLVIAALYTVLGDIAGLPVEPTTLAEDLRGLPSHWTLALLLFLVLAVFAPVAEEVFCRGWLYGMFKQRVGMYAAAVLQALLFGALHTYDPQHVAFGFVLGLFLVWIYETRNTLLTPIFVHMAWNTLASLPLIGLMLLNSHTPASDMESAAHMPDWYASGVWEQMVERRPAAQEQLDYARSTFGSDGPGIWKAEIAALQKVGELNPQADLTAAEAEVGIIEVMGYRLRDPRRGIVLADSLLASLGEGAEEYAERAMALRSAYQLMTGEYEAAREGFRDVLKVLVPRPALVAFCRRGLALSKVRLWEAAEGEDRSEVRSRVRGWMEDLFEEKVYH